jgi:hypothetical protein
MKKIVCCSLMLVASLAFADAKKGEKAPATPAMKPPTPPAELKVLEFLVGDWACEGKHEAGPMGPGFAFKSKMMYRMMLNDFWIMFSGEQEKTKENPMAHGDTGMMTYDPMSKKFMVTVFFPGPGWVNASAGAFEGDKQVWNGDGQMMGKHMTGRHTFTKKSDTEYMSVFEMSPDGKTWAKTGEETCKKGKTCVETVMCIAGSHWDSNACKCVPGAK